jgi:hypothetical protein
VRKIKEKDDASGGYLPVFDPGSILSLIFFSRAIYRRNEMNILFRKFRHGFHIINCANGKLTRFSLEARSAPPVSPHL